MSDLISRSEVWKAFISRVDSICDLGDVREILDSIPTAEPTIDLVRCGECKWYEPRHIEENGIECAGQCIWHIGLKTYCDAHNREDLEDRPRMIIFREPTDFCSYGEGEPMEIYSGHKGKDRVCFNCEHNKRMPKSTYVRCICDIDGHYIGYLENFDCWCRRWAKERRSDEE